MSMVLLVLSSVLVLVALYSGIELWRGRSTEIFAAESLCITALLGLLVGGGMNLFSRQKAGTLGRRDALLLVALSWLVGAALAAMPFWIWARLSPRAYVSHPFHSFVNCYFEAMSALTTTGATVLSDIEFLPHGMLLWRSLNHWFGGLGIVVLFVAVLPSLGVGGKRLYRIESPGPTPDGLSPQIRDTARALWFIYLGLTLVEIVALRLAGMPWFDSACHTFGTLATGGFSTRNASIGAYSSVPIRIIIIVFMLIAGMNFGLFYQLLRGRVAQVWRDTELRVYLVFLSIGSLLVVLSLMGHEVTSTTGEVLPTSAGTAIMEGVFTTVSIQTTTGFCTSDFNTWPNLAKMVLVTLMLVGGCAGSTSGGIKVIRVWMVMKIMLAEIELAFRPKVLRPLKVGGAAIDEDLKRETLVFTMGLLCLLVMGTITLLLLEQGHCSLTTAATASVASLCTIGPGLAAVGAIANYGWMADASKIVLSLLMVIGRLELYAIIVLFSPRFWTND